MHQHQPRDLAEAHGAAPGRLMPAPESDADAAGTVARSASPPSTGAARLAAAALATLTSMEMAPDPAPLPPLLPAHSSGMKYGSWCSDGTWKSALLLLPSFLTCAGAAHCALTFCERGAEPEGWSPPIVAGLGDRATGRRPGASVPRRKVHIRGWKTWNLPASPCSMSRQCQRQCCRRRFLV